MCKRKGYIYVCNIYIYIYIFYILAVYINANMYIYIYTLILHIRGNQPTYMVQAFSKKKFSDKLQ